jgi:hypothetical protein
MNQAWLTLLKRDLLLAFRRRSDVATTVFFFLMGPRRLYSAILRLACFGSRHYWRE